MFFRELINRRLNTTIQYAYRGLDVGTPILQSALSLRFYYN
jgi:hypothetical protein